MQAYPSKYKAYTINFVGLKQNVYHFNYSIDHHFFALFETSPISESAVKVAVRLEKKTNLLMLDFTIKGTVNVLCDRCTEPFDMAIDKEFPIIVKFTHNVDQENYNDEIIYLSPEASSINVAQLIYEFIVLSMPIKKTHPNDDAGNSLCAPDILAILAQKSVQNDKPNDSIDPRWAALAKLKNKTNKKP